MKFCNKFKKYSDEEGVGNNVMNVKDMYDYLRSLSGTEPKIKFYFGIKESNIDMAYQKLDEFVEKIMFFVTEKECVIK